MRRSVILGCALMAAIAAAGVGLLAQAPAQAQKAPLTLEQYDAAMKAINTDYQSLGRNTTMMNLAAGAMDATKLEPVFQDVLFYWEFRQGTEAIPFAKGVLTALADYKKAAAANDQTAAAAARAAVTPNCMGCHMLHRERLPDGSSRMK